MYCNFYKLYTTYHTISMYSKEQSNILEYTLLVIFEISLIEICASSAHRLSDVFSPSFALKQYLNFKVKSVKICLQQLQSFPSHAMCKQKCKNKTLWFMHFTTSLHT